MWNDAACINQAEEFEKGHEVQSMSAMYGRARRTAIWLAETDSAAPT